MYEVGKVPDTFVFLPLPCTLLRVAAGEWGTRGQGAASSTCGQEESNPQRICMRIERSSRVWLLHSASLEAHFIHQC